MTIEAMKQALEALEFLALENFVELDKPDNAQTDASLFFRTMDTCPINKKVQLLNRAGIATTGWWDGKEKWYIGWFPIPKIPDNLKKEIVGDTRT